MEASGKLQFGCNRVTRAAVVLAALSAGALVVVAQDLMPTKESDVRPLMDNPMTQWGSDLTNWVELSYGHAWVNDSTAYFQRRQQVPAQSFGGVESFHWQTGIGTNDLLQIDGRGIFDNHDYLLQVSYTKDKVGFVRAGFREYRTWYDLSGGLSPLGNIWIQPWDRQGAVDRGEVWFEAGLRLEDVPEITFRYSHEFRDGMKDSTSWGDTQVNQGATPAIIRNIVPSIWDLDERRDIFEFDVKHTISKTDFGIGLRYERISQEIPRTY